MLDYRQFSTFIKDREKNIQEKIIKSIDIKGDEMDYSRLWENEEE